jgi:hypothetical protein
VALHLGPAQLADAVLRAEAAAHPGDQRVHRIGEPRRLLRRCAGRQADIEVDVAVAEMAEGHRPAAGQQLLAERQRPLQEARHGGDGDRDVVLGGRAGAAQPLDDRLADLPQAARLLLAGGDGGVEHQPVLQRGGQRLLQHRAERRLGGARQLDQQVVAIAGQRVGGARDMGQRQLDAGARHQLEAGHRVG